ncbi:MAG: hypothetical protein HYS86_04580 [Candidatus Chisholmbacteria bacterium]|nr:hypothetical protein [Candidatus Chisholmbacteria bacterium]
MSKAKKKPSSKNLSLLTLVALVIAAAIATPYIWGDYRAEEIALVADIRGYSRDQQVTLEKISQLIILPSNEFPTQAIIKNTENFATHPFLSKAQPGDYLLIYPGENLVIVYRPSLNKIVITGQARDTAVNVEENEKITE